MEKEFIGAVRDVQGKFGQMFGITFTQEEVFRMGELLRAKGRVYLDLKQGKSGKWYMEVSKFTPKSREERQLVAEAEDTAIDPDQLPF